MRSESTFELAGAVENADEAIKAAQRDLPDVALVDVRMPGGGERATRGIKRASPHTRVIVFSAQDDPPTRQAMFDAGADGYLVKGSLVTAIIASIRACGHCLGQCARVARGLSLTVRRPQPVSARRASSALASAAFRSNSANRGASSPASEAPARPSSR